MSNEATSKNVLLSQIDPPFHALREINKETADYLSLVDSVKKNGIINAIKLRPIPSETGEERYQVVEGNHRYSASKDAGLESIPATISELDDNQVLHVQLIGNHHKINTKPWEFSKQLIEIMLKNPSYTKAKIAEMLSVSTSWVDNRLKLANLTPEIGQLVDEGEINLSNGYALTKLPMDKQAQFKVEAMQQNPNEFGNTIAAYKKSLDQSNQTGKDVPDEFVPNPHVRKPSDLKDELAKLAVLPILLKDQGLESEDARRAAVLTLQWVLNVDPKSNEVGKREFDEKKAKKEADKAAGRVERLAAQQKRQQIRGERIALEKAEVEAGRNPEEALAAFDKAHGIEKKAQIVTSA